jgi:glycerophosphoryl diester phosphodiesterase
MTPWPYPRVLAHRGGGALAPENTLAAIEVGHRRGFRAIEFDVMLSADGEPVLMHDETLDRTTDGRGPVAARRFAELERLDAGSWFAPEFAGEPVPHLAKVVELCGRRGIWMNAEIKPSSGADEATGRTVAAFLQDRDAGSALGQVGGRPAALLSSFSEPALAAARAVAPALPRGLLVGRVPPDWARRLADLQCVALHCDHRYLDPATVASVHRAGYWVFCYTVNDPNRLDVLAGWGVDAVCTDRRSHNVEMGIIDRITLFIGGGDDAEWLGIDDLVTPVRRLANFAHTDAAIDAGHTHSRDGGDGMIGAILG